MIPSMFSNDFLSRAWEVFVLFLIPIGGGIPAGVVLGQKHAIAWPILMFLYFISDVVLACTFEPVLKFFLKLSQSSPALSRFKAALSQSTRKTIAHHGINPGPFSLIMITFGTDPMTGRSIAFAAGHGFLSGWMLTIIGDMLYFSVIMASTLWLNNILGDGTWTTLIIMFAMIAVPSIIKKFKKPTGSTLPPTHPV